MAFRQNEGEGLNPQKNTGATNGPRC